MKNPDFVIGEYYHIYNRGVDKRKIFDEKFDLQRFLESMLLFNNEGLINDLHEVRRGSSTPSEFLEILKSSRDLVEVVCFCLNPNHYHFLVKQLVDDGISKFMHKLGTGYTNFYNTKNERVGSLFQGKFKAKHMESNIQLVYTSCCINLNDKIHNISEGDRELVFSSWGEYVGEGKSLDICGKDIILEQFDDIEDYKKHAYEVMENSKRIKKKNKDALKEEYLE